MSTVTVVTANINGYHIYWFHVLTFVGVAI